MASGGNVQYTDSFAKSFHLAIHHPSSGKNATGNVGHSNIRLPSFSDPEALQILD